MHFPDVLVAAIGLLQAITVYLTKRASGHAKEASDHAQDATAAAEETQAIQISTLEHLLDENGNTKHLA